jgi:hypothetical protein
VQGERRTQQVAAQVLATLPVMGVDADAGVEREAALEGGALRRMERLVLAQPLRTAAP